MLRDEKEAALNAVLSQLKENVEITGKLEDLAENAQLSAHLVQQQRLYRRYEASVQSAIHSLGYLPAEPDPDRQTAKKALLKLKKLFATDTDAAIRQQATEMRRQLRAKVQKALELDIGGGLQELLNRMQTDLHKAGPT
jgi:hypothetical protein